MATWQGKVAVITGGGKGIGLATARAFLARGARVVVADVDALAGEKAAASLGEGCEFVHTDTTSVASVRELVDGVAGRLGGIHLLHNNAAILTRHETLDEWDPEVFRREIDVDLTALFITSQAVTPVMRAQGGGLIVNMSSLGGIMAVPRSLAYATAKAGVLGLTRTLAALLEPDGIRVNAILPNMVDTPMVAGHTDDYPGRILQPEDIAAGVEYLADHDASGLFLSVNPGPDGRRTFSRVTEPQQEPLAP